MKLAVSLFCVATLSLAACTDEVALGGGQGEGITPDKIAFVDPQGGPLAFNPQTDVVVEITKIGSASADAVCDGCVVTSYRVIDTSYLIDEVHLVSGDVPLCRLFLSHDEVVVDECSSNTL